MFTKEQFAVLRPDVAERVARTRQELERSTLDSYGALAATLADDVLWCAVAAYVLDGNISEFRQKLAEGTELRIGLFRRFRAGAPLLLEGDHLRPGPYAPEVGIWEGSVSNDAFEWMFYALAAARLDLAEELARLIGDVPSDHTSDTYCFSLKHSLLNRYDVARCYLRRLSETPPLGRRNEYWRVLTQIAAPQDGRGLPDIQQLVATLDRAHRRNVQNEPPYPPFVAGTEQELLSLWGIGLANLARYKGIVDRIEFSSELIPSKLVI